MYSVTKIHSYYKHWPVIVYIIELYALSVTYTYSPTLYNPSVLFGQTPFARPYIMERDL